MAFITIKSNIELASIALFKNIVSRTEARNVLISCYIPTVHILFI